MNATLLSLQVWRTFTEHLHLAIAERKLHKHHRLLAAAGAVLDNLLQQCVRKGDVSLTLPLQLWIEQKEVFLEDSRRTAISLLENTILVCDARKKFDYFLNITALRST